MPAIQRVRMSGLPKNCNRAPITGGGRGRHNLHRVYQNAVTASPRGAGDIDSSLTSPSIRKSSSKSAVTSGNTLHITQAVLFPLPCEGMDDGESCILSWVHGGNQLVNMYVPNAGSSAKSYPQLVRIYVAERSYNPYLLLYRVIKPMSSIVLHTLSLFRQIVEGHPKNKNVPVPQHQYPQFLWRPS